MHINVVFVIRYSAVSFTLVDSVCECILLPDDNVRDCILLPDDYVRDCIMLPDDYVRDYTIVW